MFITRGQNKTTNNFWSQQNIIHTLLNVFPMVILNDQKYYIKEADARIPSNVTFNRNIMILESLLTMGNIQLELDRIAFYMIIMSLN